MRPSSASEPASTRITSTGPVLDARTSPHAGASVALANAIRDAVYDLIARNRHRWSKKSVQCRIPRPAERHRFL